MTVELMKPEYDFSKGERGKFYRPDAKLNVPLDLNTEGAPVDGDEGARPPGHECPGYDATEKPAEAGS